MADREDLDRLVAEEILGSVDFPAESSPIPLDEAARGRATDSLLAALDLADQIARRLDLPRVRIRIANARREVPR